MKKIIICCDRCGKTIEGNPMKLNCDYVGRVDDMEVHQEMPKPLRDLLISECERDYCEGCMQEILEFAHINLDAETFFEDKARKTGDDEGVSPDPAKVPEPEQEEQKTCQQKESIREEEQKTCQPEKAKRGRPPKGSVPARAGYLTGKQRIAIEQMYARGMDPAEVSRKLGIPEKVVIKAITSLEKLG